LKEGAVSAKAMMNIPLTMRSIVERAYRFFPKKKK